ncbi:hypothetical protein NX059_011763 [Plenodomus lindquistii]|nr:hypothetical protein NX059_011763 [Plenodomus lindquistii]
MSAPRVLRIEQGQSYLLEDNDELPYTLIRNLGHGSCANVEEVRDIRTGATLAKKVIKFHGSRLEMRRIFDNELKVMHRLTRHHHIIQVFASYIGRREVGLILSPVASHGSLDVLIQDAVDHSISQSGLDILYLSFGCLVSGLQFMHTQSIRHKDIKPHNILVHNGTLIYTDFGSSLDYGAVGRSVTTGPSHSGTRRYMAPEAHNNSPRSSKTDIFSLGCVFIEILNALGTCPLPTNVTPYCQHIDTIVSLLMTDLENSMDNWLAVVRSETSKMLSFEVKDRVSANDLVRAFWNSIPRVNDNYHLPYQSPGQQFRTARPRQDLLSDPWSSNIAGVPYQMDGTSQPDSVFLEDPWSHLSPAPGRRNHRNPFESSMHEHSQDDHIGR